MTPWDDEGINTLWLFTPDEFKTLPDGTELTCIDGEVSVKGSDDIDLDTRFGHIAYGVRDPWNHALKDMFLVFKLKS